MSKERNNLTVKIFALIIAVILWSYVMSEENPTITREISVAVEMNNLSSLEDRGLMLIEPKEPKVTLKVSGKRNTINKLTDDDILATVDLKGYDEGTVRIPIEVEVPPDISVVEKNPRELSFKIEKIVSKEVVIEVETKGELPKGYILGDPKVVPQSLYVEGARSWIESLDRAVVNIDLSNRTEDISLNAPIQLLNSKGDIIRDVEKEKNTVDVFIPIYQTKQVPIELNLTNMKDEHKDLKLGLKPNSVEITGKKEALEKVNSIKTEPIDVQQIYSGITVSLIIPEDVHLITKDEIKLIINPKTEENLEDKDDISSKVFRYSVGNMNIIGLKDGLKLDTGSLSTTVELTIKGHKSTINIMNKKDFDIQLDLTNLNEGEHIVAPVVPAKPGVTLASIAPENLKIKLVKGD